MTRHLLLLSFCFFSFPILVLSQTKAASTAYKIPERDCQVLKLKLSNFITEMNKVPGSGGHIFVYEGNDEMVVADNNGKKTVRQILPRAGEINYQITAIQEMLKSLNAPVEKIKVMNGGFRKKFAVEFWTVPKGAEPPRPTPNLKKMKYRKGPIPAQFPYWDC